METNNYMIEVENVSMRFNLGIEKGFSFALGCLDTKSDPPPPRPMLILEIGKMVTSPVVMGSPQQC